MGSGNSKGTMEVVRPPNVKKTKKLFKELSLEKDFKLPADSPAAQVVKDTNCLEYVTPFCALVWTWKGNEGLWPRFGSLEIDDIERLTERIYLKGEPSWDSHYVKDCLQQWLSIAKNKDLLSKKKGQGNASTEYKDCSAIAMVNSECKKPTKKELELAKDWPTSYSQCLLELSNYVQTEQHLLSLWQKCGFSTIEADRVKEIPNATTSRQAAALLCIWTHRQVNIDINTLKKLFIASKPQGLFVKLGEGTDNEQITSSALTEEEILLLTEEERKRQRVNATSEFNSWVSDRASNENSHQTLGQNIQSAGPVSPAPQFSSPLPATSIYPSLSGPYKQCERHNTPEQALASQPSLARVPYFHISLEGDLTRVPDIPTNPREGSFRTPVLNGHLSLGGDMLHAFESPAQPSTFGLSEDLGLSAKERKDEEEHEQLTHLRKEADEFQEEVNIDREEIQRSINKLQDKLERRERLIHIWSQTRTLKGKGENSYTDDILLNTKITAPKIVLGGTAMLKPWTPLEATQMTKDAPDPLTASVKYNEWLHKICIAYTPLPREVEMLLKIGYGSRWSLVKSAFQIPQERDWTILTNNMDVTENRLIHWLESIRDTINGLAVKHGDFSQVTATLQKPGESVADYILRYNEAWDNSAGVPRHTEAYKVLATQTLMNGLLASVAHS
ncbi:uncharacterized protein LOC144823713 [Lissotriton helveticus]